MTSSGLFIFWLFVAAELISLLSVVGVNMLNWRVVRRGAKPLHKLTPPLPAAAYPHIDVLICHYTEPAEETVETLEKVLALEYPPSKLHVYICDDGRLKSDFKQVDAGTAHWPTPKLNAGAIKQSGDTREAVGEFMAERITAYHEEQSAMAERAVEHAAGREREGGTEGAEGAGDGSGGGGLALSLSRVASTDPEACKLTREVFPDPSQPARAVDRTDCAAGFLEDRYTVPGRPTVSYVARLKPKVRHAESGP